MFDSLFCSIAGAEPGEEFLEIPKITSAVCVLIDGFGVANLNARSGHAKNLYRYFSASRRSLRCEFPSTTVVSLAGFSTGLRSSKHGLIGYNVRNPIDLQLNNLLSGWERNGTDPKPWKIAPTISERLGEVKVHVVANPEYENSGFTSLTMPEALFHGVQDLEDRVLKAKELGSKAGNLIYLYIPELDQIGHMYGSQSGVWSELLEQIDSALAPLLASKVPVLVTSDHGMVDVPIERQIHLDEFDFYTQSVQMTGGDTRSAFVYAQSNQDFLRQQLEDTLGSSVWVSDWDELAALGYVEPVIEPDLRFPDLVLLARAQVTLFDRRTARPRSLKMLGHHGSITDAEMQVPLIFAGGLST